MMIIIISSTVEFIIDIIENFNTNTKLIRFYIHLFQKLLFLQNSKVRNEVCIVYLRSIYHIIYALEKFVNILK